ncbi:uncharacterized protein LOC119606652 isoform X2 [Lucilia sericata]|uniref:uncharacterized protein LOC119606652 isoform X2 n=1 Tax=Lucilia sericata TaxID=13632 RepID=UPI0018A80869|nr:uncharacterized protein LOC119606652 isoform X2 [Lucilia sericata]
MEEYQIQDNGETLIETDYEVSEIFEGSVDSNDIEVVDFETFQQQPPEDSFTTTATNPKDCSAIKYLNKRKYSFVWQYFQPVVGTNQFQCLLCQSCVGSQTSNLARHLASAHDISKQRDKRLDNLVRIRPSRSFIWKYCTKEDSKHARCHLCNKILYFGGGNTANISKHLRRLHSDLIKENKNLSNSIKMDDETMQATASLSNTTTYHDDEQNNGGRSSADITSAERKERRGASYVWNYVEKLSRHTIRCRLCTKVMSFHGTANVITHLQRRHNVLGEPGSQLNQIINAKPETFTELETHDDYEHTEYEGKKFGRKSLSTASVVWKFCTRISTDQVRCCFCKKNLSYQGTSNLQRHLHRMHGVITHGRLSKATEDFVAIKEDNFKVPANVDFIWQFCSQLEEDQQRTKCNMCDALFETKDTETIVKHLAMVHSVETNNQNLNGDSKPIIMRTKKRNRHVDFDTDDDDDYDSKWAKLDDAEDQQIHTEFDETNIKKDDSLYDDIIEEDPNNYDEEPFDPSDMPQANPLSAHSSRANSPHQQSSMQYQSQQQLPQTQLLQPTNLLPPLEAKVLLKLQEDRLRMETDYFREKAGYYRMQKYLTALQAKKARIELERLSRGEATIVATTDLNGAYAVEVIPEHHIATQQ